MSGLSALRVLAIVGCLAACDQVWGLERSGDGCGDGLLAQTEDCDDGNLDAGDGCSAACRVEPGFVCRPQDAGGPCLPVVGLTRGPVATMLMLVGDMLGKPNNRMLECPGDQVAIGFEGFANSTGDNLGSIAIVCAALGIGADGVAQVTRKGTIDIMGGEIGPPMPPAMCGPDEVATGYLPVTNTYLKRFDLRCQALSHVDGKLQLGPETSHVFGPTLSAEDPPHPLQQCPANQILTVLHGHIGASLDRAAFGCSELRAAVCGDSVVTAPETCDDGNLLRFDGCDARCQPES